MCLLVYIFVLICRDFLQLFLKYLLLILRLICDAQNQKARRVELRTWGKLSLVEMSKLAEVPIICAMGAGNKLDSTKFEVADISETSVCPLARVMRTELKKRNISDVKVVYSKEIPQKSDLIDEKTGKSIPGSISFVPSVVGLIIAGEVIKDLIR